MGRRKVDMRAPLFVLLFLFLVWEVAAPLAVLIWGSISSAEPGEASFFSFSHLTIDNFERAFRGGEFGSAIRNTAIFAVGTTALAFVFGAYLAWVVERTNTPFRKLITILVIARFIVPDILTTIAWTFLASNRIGTLNHWTSSIFGIDKPLFNIYSMPGMIWIAALDFFPLAFLLMSAALRSMDPSLEEASLVSGHGIFRTTRRITFPLAIPAIVALLILLLTRGITTFETPIVVGLPARINTLVLQLWQKTSTIPTDLGVASVFAVIVLVLCIAMVWFYGRVTRKTEEFAVVGGKAFRPRRVELGRLRWLTFAGAMFILVCALILPMIMLIWAAIQPAYSGLKPLTLSSIMHNSGLTLSNFTAALDSDITRRAFVNSTILCIAAASAVVLLMAITAWVTVKSKWRGRRLLDQMVFAPIAVPAILLGIAFLWLYLVVPIPIYGTKWILLLVYIAHFMPQAFRIISAAMTQISDQLEEAAEVSGATWWQAFRTIMLPLLVPGMLAAWVFVAVLSFREFPASVMVYSHGSEVIGVSIFNLLQDGSFGLLSAFGILMLLVLLLLIGVVMLIAGRFGLRERFKEVAR